MKELTKEYFDKKFEEIKKSQEKIIKKELSYFKKENKKEVYCGNCIYYAKISFRCYCGNDKVTIPPEIHNLDHNCEYYEEIKG
jgi:hypothetical protein